MERTQPSVELLHENVAIALSYAKDLLDLCITARTEATLVEKQEGERSVAVAVPWNNVDMIIGLSVAYMALWTHVTEMQHLNADHLKDYWAALIERCSDERRTDLESSLTNFITDHRKCYGKARKSR